MTFFLYKKTDTFVFSHTDCSTNGVVTEIVEAEPAQQALRHFGSVCEKVRRRSYQRTLRQLETLQNTSQTNLDNVKSYLDVVSFGSSITRHFKIHYISDF